jgi:hypothetical protein
LGEDARCWHQSLGREDAMRLFVYAVPSSFRPAFATFAKQQQTVNLIAPDSSSVVTGVVVLLVRQQGRVNPIATLFTFLLALPTHTSECLRLFEDFLPASPRRSCRSDA